MNFAGLITILEKQLELHHDLYNLAVNKADCIKKNDLNALNQIMNQEQTYAATITMLENNRQQELQKMFPNQASLPTLSECIEHAEGTEKVKLTEIFSQLADIIEKIKEKNELNQQLIYQSLQFVNFSLSLFRPKQETVTYGPPNGKQPQLTQSTSMFNSEA